jgi:uncharacterized protein YbjT (DUF2867 family)
MSDQRVVLVTGASSGVGQSTARLLSQRGYQGPGPELVAETVLKIAASKAPRLRYLTGRQAKVVTGLRRFLPEGAFEQGVRSTFRLDRK